MTIKKADLVEKLAEKSGASKSQAKAFLNAFLETVTEALGKGETISVIGFGTFEVRERSPRKGRNPQTGEAIEIPGGNYPAFRPSRQLKEAVKSA